MHLRGFVVLILILAFFFFLSGCVRQRMTVSSYPPGATVYLDGKEIGRTPCSTGFDFYGKREFRLVKDGYETLTVVRPVRAPWYEYFPLDFASEVLLPGKLTDQKSYEFDMQPVVVVPTPELIGRADELKRRAHLNGALGAPTVSDSVRQSGSLGTPAPVAPPTPAPSYVPPKL
jgi:hypothetical protein